MVDWTKSMQQSYEFYIVDPNTWQDVTSIDTIITPCTIERDSEAQTLGSASLTTTQMIGECYVRIYLSVLQNGVRSRHPLGTFLIQSSTDEFDGRNHSIPLDGYTPLIELKEKLPPIGYTVMKDQNIMESVNNIVFNNARAPVINASCDEVLQNNFVANSEDTWLTYITDLMSIAKYKFALDEKGQILFAPEQDIQSLQPVYTFNDDNSSILYPAVSINRDLYGIPNVVEVVYINNGTPITVRAVNNDPNSTISTVSRGREIVHRISDPGLPGNPTKEEIELYANQVLRNLSSLEYTVTFTHGYYPVNIGDCVRLNYESAGIKNVKAMITAQSIKCESGCSIVETAVFSTNLWEV